MIELSKKEDWEIIHQSRKMIAALAIGDKATASQPLPLTRRLLLRLKQRLGAEVIGRMSSYQDYLLWEVIFKRFLSDIRPGAKVLEIGSAPGDLGGLTTPKKRDHCVSR